METYELHPQMKITGYEMKSGMKKGDHRRIKTGGSGKQKEKKPVFFPLICTPGVRKEEIMELANALQPGPDF